MKIVIPSKGRADTITSHELDAFQGHEVTVLVHNEKESKEYQRLNPGLDVVVTDTKPDVYGLTRQREWACGNLVDEDEWFVFCDDNVHEITCVQPPSYALQELDTHGPGNWRSVFGYRAQSGQHFADLMRDTQEAAEKVGAHVAGFATNSNPYFRGKKFRAIGYVVGKMMLWRNSHFNWDHSVSMEDFRNTAEQTLRHGAVCINNFVFPVAGHYEAGGMGTYAERIPVRKRDVQLLLEKYPGFFRVRNRKDFVPDTDLAVRFTSPSQVRTWREGMMSDRPAR